jgi:DNA mismatch repair protein MutS
MDFIQKIKNINNLDEPSLEEQVTKWKTNIGEGEVYKIMFPENEISFINEHVYDDLEFFNTNDGNNHSVCSSVSKYTITPYGKYTLKHLLRNPLQEEEQIKERQSLIKYFINNKIFADKVKNILLSIKNPDNIFWLWKSTDEYSQTLYDMVYVKIPVIDNFINSSEIILTASSVYKMFVSPFFSLITPVLCFIIPYMFFRYMGLRISFSQIFHLLKSKVFTVHFIPNKTASLAMVSTVLWFVIYFYNVYTIVNVSITTNNITNIIHDKLQLAAQLVNISKELKLIMSELPISLQKIIEVPDISNNIESLLLKDTILSNPSMFTNKGCILSTFWKIKSVLNDLADRIKFIGFVDGFYTITEYMNNLQKYELPFTYVRFNKRKKFIDFWHPSILKENDINKPVPNSLKLNKKTNTIIITGPNAAGKSTYVKTIFVNSILAQTFGIAFAKKWDLPKPYTYIDTYFKVPDVEGKTSTFQAEMKRCFNFVNTLDNIKKAGKCYSLVALDEIFTSTNYKEGISGAYSIIKYISDNFPDVLCLVTTHYHCLAELEKVSNKKIMNYCLNVIRDVNGKLTGYSFKVIRGVSDEHVALDLLEKEGFSNDIINIARDIYKNIDIPRVRFFING